MKMLPVYPVYDVEPVRGEGCFIFDQQGRKYLDLYGGHAVISIGHNHPTYVKKISEQLNKIGFYSNSVNIPIQEEYAGKLGQLCGYDDHNLFLCNSGAEAIENAIKIAAFNSKGKKVIVFDKAFHGRTSMAVACTDNKKIQTQFDNHQQILRLPLNDIDVFISNIENDVCAVMMEGIMGVGGIHQPTKEFLEVVRTKTKDHGVWLIMDEVQSGFGRSGAFFAHQIDGIEADIITIAKGMGNGFPIGGVLVSPKLKSWKGMLGSTFGGNHLACAAGLSVLEIIQKEQLIINARKMGEILKEEIGKIPQVKGIRGAGLMLGLVFDFPVSKLRKSLVMKYGIFTGSSAEANVIRLLPPLNITSEEIKLFINKLRNALELTDKKVSR